MIDREKLEKCIAALDALEGLVDISVTVTNARFSIFVYPLDWRSTLPEDLRHKALAALTPLVGKLERNNEDTTINYRGEADGISITFRRADTCQIVGYKRLTKRVPRLEVKTVEKEEEVATGEWDEEEELVPITDCEIRQGKASEQDIQVPA